MSDQLDRLTAALAHRYRIERELGAGGMATVYLAHDVRHDRRVAIKVLRPELAAVLGAERFVQEIKTTANLQHPHILPLFDSGEADGFLYYVMPYIEGETLRDKLNREKQLGIEEAVRITTEVADALDYAHRQNVIHRDIKPENILLHDGRPMVADFGIALAVSAAAGGRMTETGLSLGTPHYMSPEQATAEKDLTNRSDIYSLGAVLYEMLTGNPPHVGAMAQQIIMKIVTEEAPPVTSVRKAVPPNVAAAVARTLEKLPADRFDSAKAFAEALANPAFTLPTAAPGRSVTAAAGERWRRVVTPAAFALIAAVALWGWLRSPAEPRPAAVTRVDLSFGSVEPFATADVVVSPDGNQLAVAGVQGNTRAIFVRRLDSEAEFRPVPGTERGRYPAFSPDGEWLVFRDTERNALVRVAVSGGGALTLVQGDTIQPYDPHWGDDGTIVFATPRGLYTVPSGGGPAQALGAPRGRMPVMLPDGSGVLHVGAAGGIYFFDLAADTSRELVPEGRHPMYVEPGIVLYFGPGNALYGVPFDLQRKRVTGPPRRVLDRVAALLSSGRGYAVSRSGTLVYREGDGFGSVVEPNLVVIASRDGRADTLPLPPGNRREARFSPDGRTIAFELTNLEGGATHDLYTFDLVTSASQQITFEGDNDTPVWSPDGTKLLFDGEAREGTLGEDIFVKPVDNSAAETLVLSRPGDQWPLAWLGDDRILFGSSEAGNADLFVHSLSGNAEPQAYLEAPWSEDAFALSPDGDLAAVVTSETGSSEVWLREFPVPEGKWRISFGGGDRPRWSPDGRTLYYARYGPGADTLFAVRVDRERGVAIRDREVVFTGGFGRWDLHPDGERFLVVVPAPARAASDADAVQRYLVVLNWFAELKERMGGERS